ncbi:thiopeptide-type bacteriocin biosynthesis protein [Streptomyces sp. NPDC048191]|uniref:thiopeptide-type bacteriocin biosynthesis protein n=1 Tax=Streptomyces sp. NPDC048191 TaxID=3155484 RepID=UPI00340265B7
MSGTTIAPDGRTADRTPTVWRSWHLHLGSTAASLHDRVVTEVIGPTVDDLPGRPWFFIRYWQAGPHLRLRIGDLTEAEARGTEQALTARLAGAGRLRAGEEPVDAPSYLLSARRLAATGDGAPETGVEELLPPGVHRAVYVPETERYGGPALMPGAERLFQLSSELVRTHLPALPGPRERSAMALRATVSAGAALGPAAEQAAYYRHALDAWRGMVAAGFGYSAEQLDRLTGAGRPAPAGAGIDPGRHGPFAEWHRLLRELAQAVGETGSTHPGRIVFSHVHMVHNRLGLTLVDELQTYARLVRLFPEE